MWKNQENSVVEEELATKVKFGRKIGIFVAGTAGAGIVGVFNNSVNYPEKSLIDQLFFGASLLFTLISFLFGVVLIGGCPFRTNNPNSIQRIKFVIRVALASIIMVVMFGSALIIRRAYWLLHIRMKFEYTWRGWYTHVNGQVWIVTISFPFLYFTFLLSLYYYAVYLQVGKFAV